MNSKLFFCLLMLFSALLFWGPMALAQDENTDVVYNSQDFCDWLQSHQSTGGVLRLGADLDFQDYMSIDAKAPITIDAGSHSFYLNTPSYMAFSGPILIQGSPKGKALFETEFKAQLFISEGVILRAVGDNATAVKTNWYNGFSSYYGSIEVSGYRAKGLQVTTPEPFALATVSIDANGQEAVCVDASQGPMDIFLCRLKASGQKAQSVISGSDTVVDTSRCSPTPQSAATILPEQHQVSLLTIFDNNTHYQSIMEDYSHSLRLDLAFSETERTPNRILSVDWLPNKPLPDTPGTYTHKGELDLPSEYKELLPPSFTSEITLKLLDPSVPYLYPEFQVDSNGQTTITYFQSTSDPNAKIILYLSEDNGRSWYNPEAVPFNEHEPYLYWTEGYLHFKDWFLEEKTYLMQLEIVSDDLSGASNILELSTSANHQTIIKEFGGDRDFSDRGDAPAPVIPAPSDPLPKAEAPLSTESITYTQNQLADMAAANPAYLTFFGHNFQVSADTNTLLATLSSPSDSLSVQLTPLDGSRYQIELLKNGTPILFSDNPLIVHINCALRDQESLDQLSFKKEDGTPAAITAYNKDAKQLEIHVNTSGIYHLSSSWTPPIQTKSTLSPADSKGLNGLSALFIFLLLIAILTLLGVKRKRI